MSSVLTFGCDSQNLASKSIISTWWWLSAASLTAPTVLLQDIVPLVIFNDGEAKKPPNDVHPATLQKINVLFKSKEIAVFKNGPTIQVLDV